MHLSKLASAVLASGLILAPCLERSAAASVVQLSSISAPETASITNVLIAQSGIPSVSLGGNTLTFTNSFNSFLVNTVGVDYFGSAFPNGSTILYSEYVKYRFGAGPMTLTFAEPVDEFGFNVEDYEPGPSVFTFKVLDGSAVLATFSALGDDPAQGSSSLLAFLGAEASGGAEITSVVVTDSTSEIIAVGPVSFADASPNAAAMAPEPASLWLTGVGLAASVASRYRLRKR